MHVMVFFIVINCRKKGIHPHVETVAIDVIGGGSIASIFNEKTEFGLALLRRLPKL